MRTLRAMPSRCAAFGALALLLVPPAARAQARGELKVGLLLGGHLFANDVELGVPDLPNLAHSLDDTWMLGAHVGYAFTPTLTAEAELAAIPSRDNEAGRRVFVLGWRAHGLVHLPSAGRVRPFLLAGVGALSSFGGGEGFGEIMNDTDFVPHFGVGMKVDLVSQLSLRLDFRRLLPPSTRSKGVTQDTEFFAGISYRFGGASAPAHAGGEAPPPAP